MGKHYKRDRFTGKEINPYYGGVLGYGALEESYFWIRAILENIEEIEKEKCELERQADGLMSSWKIDANSIKGTRKEDPKIIYLNKMENLNARLEFEQECLSKRLEVAGACWRNLSDTEKKAMKLILNEWRKSSEVRER
jgi:hypothetical protein